MHETHRQRLEREKEQTKRAREDARRAADARLKARGLASPARTRAVLRRRCRNSIEHGALVGALLRRSVETDE